jgi:glyoxylase-like metal-dependent hydrolase (beta-lactamase superfamily II)
MKITQIAPHVTAISLGFVNVFLIDRGELTLIDTGTPGSAPAILDGIRAARCQPVDLKHILISHLHVDHVGGAKALQADTGAQVHMHPLDAQALAAGQTMREVEPGPGLLNRLIVPMMKHAPGSGSVETPVVDCPLEDGQVFAFAGGLRVIHAPGHTAGHVVFLLPSESTGAGAVLFAGDACSNMLRLGPSFLYESYEEGRRTLGRLAHLAFDTAVFAHGKPMHDAARRFREMWRD